MTPLLGRLPGDRTEGEFVYIAAACAVAFIVIAAWMSASRRMVLACAASAVVAATLVAALIIDGPRWFVVSIVVASLLAWAAVVMRRRQGPALAVTATVIAALFALVAGACAWALPGLDWPGTGDGIVGTTTIQWTTDRDEPATADGGDKRILVAQVWYPAVGHTGTEHRYWGGPAETKAVASALSGSYGIPAFTLDGASRAVTQARENAEPATYTPWPVVIFSPGLGGLRTQNTALAQELAASGMVVIALDHPYDSAVTVLRDGTVVTSQTSSTGDDAKDQELANGWAATRAADIASTIALVDLWRNGPLPDVAPGMPDLGRHFDMKHLGLVGHSIGGAAAVLAASKDPRVEAVVNLDGLPRGGQPTVPMLTILAGAGLAGQLEGAAYRAAVTESGRNNRCALQLTVPGATHLSITDAGLFLPPLPTLVGANARGSDVRMTQKVTVVFLLHAWAAMPMKPLLETVAPVAGTCS